MRVEDHRRHIDIPSDPSADHCACIAVEIREEAHVDRERDDEEDHEVLDDTIVSHFLEQEDVGDERTDSHPIEEMAQADEGADMRDVIDDKRKDQDDIEELQELLGPGGHGDKECMNSFHGLGGEIVLGRAGDPFACEDTPDGDLLLFILGRRVELDQLINEIVESGEDECVDCQSDIDVGNLVEDHEEDRAERQDGELVSQVVLGLSVLSENEDHERDNA